MKNLKLFINILIYLLFLTNIYASGADGCDCSDGGGDSDGGSSGFRLEEPPILPPSFRDVQMERIKRGIKDTPEEIAAREARAAETRKILIARQIVSDREVKALKRMIKKGVQKRLEFKQDQAFKEKYKAERNLKIAKTVGYVDAGAAAVVGAVATGAAAATVATASAIGDGVAAAAGSLSDSYQNSKSIKQALKDATIEGVKKGIFSKYLAISKAGGKFTSAAANFASGQFYDYANSSAQNEKE